MPLTISLHFPTGKYVAAAWNDRTEPEWPPHPARFCLGLVDALHKSGNHPDERAALQSLCAQGSPEIILPENVVSHSQSGYYVPQNPTTFKGGITPGRKPRSFPTVMLDSEKPCVFFHWPQASLEATQLDALAALLTKLPRFGHSSSLVIAEVSDALQARGLRLIPAGGEFPHTPQHLLRVPYSGMLESAEASFNATDREKERIALVAKNEKKAKPGKFLSPSASPRGRHDPAHQWESYSPATESNPISSLWDERIIILQRKSGDILPITAALALTSTFHRTILDRWDRDGTRGPVPEWISGHRLDGSRTKKPHLAIFTLPDIRSRFLGDSAESLIHASGSIKAIGLAIPRPESLELAPALLRSELKMLLQALFTDNGGQEIQIVSRSRSWASDFTLESEIRPILAVRPHRWTKPSDIWASVTPVILDKHPKTNFKKDPHAWAASCADIISKSIVRAGLPEPIEIIAGIHSPIDGVPPASAFPAQEKRPGRQARFHVHATVRFAENVRGPLLIGAGRYRGYGQFIPLTNPKKP